MAKTKKSDNLEYCRGIRVMDVAVYVFALLAFGVYPLIYDDHYLILRSQNIISFYMRPVSIWRLH